VVATVGSYRLRMEEKLNYIYEKKSKKTAVSDKKIQIAGDGKKIEKILKNIKNRKKQSHKVQYRGIRIGKYHGDCDGTRLLGPTAVVAVLPVVRLFAGCCKGTWRRRLLAKSAELMMATIGGGEIQETKALSRNVCRELSFISTLLLVKGEKCRCVGGAESS
jgi:hypothetical protein